MINGRSGKAVGVLALGLALAWSGSASGEGLRYREQAGVDAPQVAVAPAPRPLTAQSDHRAVRSRHRSARNAPDSWLPSWVVALAGVAAPAPPTPPTPRRIASPRPARTQPTATSLRPTIVAAPASTRIPATIEVAPAGKVVAEPSRTAPQVRELAPAPVPPATPLPAQPLVTGALPLPALLPPPVTDHATPEAAAPPEPLETPAARVRAIELDKARRDLVKLELASRVYSEQRMAGQRVFATAPDWVVLEHANEAMNEPDWAAATASGFEAVAYINDVERVVVVAIAGTQDLRRDFITNDVWQALIRAETPQQFYFATQYVKSVKRRYVSGAYTIECVGHSLGGGACAYAAADSGIAARVINPISAGRLDPRHAHLITNYVVDREIASLVYGARGNGLSGAVHVISDGNDRLARERIIERWGRLGGIAVVIDDLRGAIDGHRVDAALDKIARMAEATRPRALAP